MNELQKAEFAADLRETFANVAEAGWKGRDYGIPLTQTLLIVLPSAEELVQSIVSAVER